MNLSSAYFVFAVKERHQVSADIVRSLNFNVFALNFDSAPIQIKQFDPSKSHSTWMTPVGEDTNMDCNLIGWFDFSGIVVPCWHHFCLKQWRVIKRRLVPCWFKWYIDTQFNVLQSFQKLLLNTVIMRKLKKFSTVFGI